jgi:hypothetical protein
MIRFGVKVKPVMVAGEEVMLRSLTGGANAVRIVELLQEVGVKPALMVEIGALLAAECVVKPDGSPVFQSDLEARASCSIGFLKELISPALVISGLGEDAEDLAKNSGPGQ